MVTTSWSDINRDGRRLEAIIKQMNTKFHATQDPDMQLAYVDRIIKATHEKVEIAKTVLGVKTIIKDIKIEPQELYAV